MIDFICFDRSIGRSFNRNKLNNFFSPSDGRGVEGRPSINFEVDDAVDKLKRYGLVCLYLISLIFFSFVFFVFGAGV